MSSTRLNITLPEKLSLPGVDKASMMLLTAGHIFLAINILSAYIGIFPLIGVLFAFICFTIEHYRKQVMAKDAVIFAYSRLFLTIAVLTSAIVLLPVYVPAIGNTQIWNLLLFTLGPLSFFDAYQTAKGKLGIRLIYYIKQELLDKFNKV